MRGKELIFIVGAASLSLAASVFALPPDRGPGATNTAANAAEVYTDCMAACTPHSTAQLCQGQCNRALHPIGLLPASAYAGIPPDATSCAIMEAGAWAWYGTCTYLVSQAGGALTPAVTSSLSSVLGNASYANTLVQGVSGAAGAVVDPCGSIRDKILKDQMSEGCPASTIFQKLGLPPPVVPK